MYTDLSVECGFLLYVQCLFFLYTEDFAVICALVRIQCSEMSSVVMVAEMTVMYLFKCVVVADDVNGTALKLLTVMGEEGRSNGAR